MKKTPRAFLIPVLLITATLSIVWSAKQSRHRTSELRSSQIKPEINWGRGDDLRSHRVRHESIDYGDPRLRNLYDRPMEMLDVKAFEGYLAANKRSPRSLVAVFGLTEDQGILSELMDHTDQSNVLLALGMSRTLSADQKLKYAEMYLEKNPDDMMGYLLVAGLSRSSGSEDKIVDYVKRGIAAKEISTGDSQRSKDMKEALMSAGRDNANAEIFLAVNDRNSVSVLLTSMRMLQKASEIASKGLDDAAKNSVYAENIYYAESLRELSSVVDSDSEAYYQMFIKEMVSKIKGDVDLGNGLGSSEDFMNEKNKERKELLQLRDSFNKKLKAAPPEAVDAYFREKSIRGEQASQRWFLDQPF